MTSAKSLAAIFCLGYALVFGGGLLAADDATVEWHNVTSPILPSAFVLNPVAPATTDLIRFVAGTDGEIYPNSCFASVANGDPFITIDPTNQTIKVSFSEPRTNSVCPLIFYPVSGTDGEFGPLRAGTWGFQILQNSNTFIVAEAPILLSIRVLANSRSFELSWPISGEVFFLESTEAPGSSNWLVITNVPLISSNRASVQIPAGSAVRFFRLHRLSDQVAAPLTHTASAKQVQVHYKGGIATKAHADKE